MRTSRFRPRRAPALPWILLALLPLTACATGPRLGTGARLVDGDSGMDLTPAMAAERLQDYDVVFLGEQHGNQPVHRTHLALLRALAERRADIALSMEMFERDEQLTLSRYLAGELDEEQMLAQIETWPRYERDYRPMVEFARRRGIPVLAANAPRSLARRVGREGLAAVAGEPYLPANVDLSRGEYFEGFCEAMGMSADEEGETAEWLGRLYEAQRLWDASMAETIARHFDEERERLQRPLVVHVVGSFHVSGGLGTMQVLRGMRPDLEIALVDVVSLPDAELDVYQLEPDGVADFVVLAPELPPRNVDSAQVHGTPHGKVHGKQGGAPEQEVVPEEQPPEEEPPEEEFMEEPVVEEPAVEEPILSPAEVSGEPTSQPTSRPASQPAGGAGGSGDR